MQIRNNDILSTDILPVIFQNYRSAKQAIGTGQDRMKTEHIIAISCNDANESGWKSEISVSTSKITELKRIGNLPVLDPKWRIKPRETSKAVGTALGTVHNETVPIP